MSIIPYRTQQRLKRALIIALIALLIGVIIWGLWVLWLQRFVVYTRDAGAVLDFSKETIPLEGPVAMPPQTEMEIEIHYNEGDDMRNVNIQMAQMNGYYVDAATLTQGTDALWEKVKDLPEGTPIMLDMKNGYGSFFYTTSTGFAQSDSISPIAVDALIENMRKAGFYLIARVPALRDRAFAEAYYNSGLNTGRGYLWMDEDGCYWLDPTTQDTTMHLITIATELREKGFAEVMFDYYYFPDTTDFVFQQDPMQALSATAQTLVDTCSANNFTVSFINNGFAWAPPTGRSRVYMNNVMDTTQLGAITEGMNLSDPTIRLVLLTNNMDTRFEQYSVLRPIQMAH